MSRIVLVVQVMLLGIVGVLASLRIATAHEATAAATQVDAKPIECWWKTDKASVHIAERVSLTLTCRVVTSNRASVVPLFAHLDPGAIQLAPFEVVGGRRQADIRSGIWTYFQYIYELRLIVDDAFGDDVAIPPLAVQYSIHMRDGDGASQQGRDRTYLLPALMVRLQTLVPNKTDDIRDVSRETFDDVMLRDRRASRAATAAITLFSFAGLCLVLACVAAVRYFRAQRTRRSELLSSHTVLRGAVRCLKQAQHSSNADVAQSIETAMASIRIIAATAADVPVAQQEVSTKASVREGQLIVRRGLLKRRAVAISAAMTPNAIDRYLATEAASNADVLSELRDAMVTLSGYRYTRDPELDGASVTSHLERCVAAARTLQLRMLWRRGRISALPTPRRFGATT